jgi:hypothetical protein
MRIVLVAHRESETNLRLVEAAPRDVSFEMLSPTRAIGSLASGDAALARLDVLPTIDGIEPGLWEIGRLEAEGVRVFNGRRALLTTHDKLQTSPFSTPRACRIHARRTSPLFGSTGSSSLR